MEDLHRSLKKHLAAFWEELRSTPFSHLAHRHEEILKKMSSLEEISHKIGGSVAVDISKLSSDVQRYLLGQMSLSEARQMVEDALKVEQDTREL